MNKFLPQVGGHDLHLDDFMLTQNAYLEGFKALVYKFGNNGHVILDGVFTSISGSNLVWTEGYVALFGEIYKVPAGSISYSGSGLLYVKPEETVLNPSPTLYEDGGLKNVHLQRIAVLKYKAVDTDGEEYAKMTRPGVHLPGDLQDWIVPPGKLVSDFFDATGLGIGIRTGWAICNGLNGTPDLRGQGRAMATNVPSTGAAGLPSSLSGIVTNVGDSAGKNLFQLLQAHLPNYMLNVNDPGHLHKYAYPYRGGGYGEGPVERNSANNQRNDDTTISTTGISVNSGGGDQAHDVRQPTTYVYTLLKLS